MTDIENIIRSIEAFNNLTSGDVARLIELNTKIRNHTGNWGVHQGGEKNANGSIEMPWVEKDPLIIEFMDFMYDNNLLPQFDWIEWKEGLDLFASTDPTKYNRVDLETSLKIFYGAIRKDRFSDGTLVWAFEKGVFPKLVNRLVELKHETKSHLVIGAIIGDIVGSIYEFHNIKTKDFPLFGKHNVFTDDSVLTIATMQALLDGGTANDFVTNYQQFGIKYPSSYGIRFSTWLKSKDPQPYSSWGNGSAMRVSPVAWFYNNLETVEAAAKLSASVTHNHPEGIKGAQATAAAIFMARSGQSKQEIKTYLEHQYDYLLDFTLEDIRPNYGFDESCKGTVPPAIVAFLESNDFEDAIRNAVSLGGDSDTLAAITGSVAQAFYNISEEIRDQAMAYLPEELRGILEQFGIESN